MIPLIILIFLQLTIALVIIFVLKRLLDRELEKAAIEKLMSLKANADVKVVNIYHAKPLTLNVEEEFKSLVKNKFVGSEIVFERISNLRGGLIIKAADEVLDFSVSSRLENLWS